MGNYHHACRHERCNEREPEGCLFDACVITPPCRYTTTLCTRCNFDAAEWRSRKAPSATVYTAKRTAQVVKATGQSQPVGLQHRSTHALCSVMQMYIHTYDFADCTRVKRNRTLSSHFTLRAPTTPGTTALMGKP